MARADEHSRNEAGLSGAATAPDTHQAAWRRHLGMGGVQATPLPGKSVLLVGCVLFWLCLLFAGPPQQNPTFAIGRDIPYRYLLDPAGEVSFDAFLAMPDEALALGQRPMSEGYVRDVAWLRFHIPGTAFAEGELWLKLSPNYLDSVTVYLRPEGAPQGWVERRAGDRMGARAGDIDYRYTVLRLAPPAQGGGHEVVMRIQTTSALLVEPTLWQPAAFTDHALRDTAFWSFYFGIGALSSALALLLAIGLKTRLLWSVIPFSFTYLLVASIQGYIGWGDADWRLTLQHYLTGTLSLLGYPALIWMCTEALDIRLRFPRVYRWLVASFCLGLLFPLSIPLDLYGETVRVFTVLAFANALVIAACSLRLWWRWGLSHLNLAFGILPLFYVVSGLMAVLITTATIDYAPRMYTLWQSSMMIIMMATMLLVMAVGVYRIRHERRTHWEREQLARELRMEREASFHQRQFMGMVSHEFRTPLAVISGTLENLLAQPTEDARVRQRYDKIQRAANRLVQLTDNCLADARLSAGTLYLDTVPTPLLPLLESAASLVEVGDTHDLRITLDGLPVPHGVDAGPVLPADAALLRICLSNLLDNAVKYTPAGTIRVDVQVGDNRIVVSISDRGPGIPAAQAEEVFERYRRGARPDAERAGSGLGLFVSRQIARAHGGELTLAANTAHGCRFDLVLPTACTAG
ncbi:histidine kinase [Verticiella sediminum]|uniref:histidine kinase n=1 Tax=Verticiella sediminum TaxID=1247510 RepID=A0A556AQ27_9BURK|nr:ATP-binding protein [Verticiella sediminum]TSH95008.1 histidine kinase [Verticiella sediminum]